MKYLATERLVKPAILLAFVLFAVVGLNGATAFADESAAPSSIDNAPCVAVHAETTAAGPEATPATTDSQGTRITHGDWHPCANDPNACGAGHSCCDGHCVKGSCGG